MRHRLRLFGSYVVRPHGGEHPWWSLHDASLGTPVRGVKDAGIFRSSYKPSLYTVADRILHKRAPITPSELRRCSRALFADHSIFKYYKETYLDPNSDTDWLYGGLAPWYVRDVTAILPEGEPYVRRYNRSSEPLVAVPEIRPNDSREIYRETLCPLASLANPVRLRKRGFNTGGGFDPEWIDDARVACRILLKYGLENTSSFDMFQNGMEWLRGLSLKLSNRYGGDWGTNLPPGGSHG